MKNSLSYIHINISANILACILFTPTFVKFFSQRLFP